MFAAFVDERLRQEKENRRKLNKPKSNPHTVRR